METKTVTFKAHAETVGHAFRDQLLLGIMEHQFPSSWRRARCLIALLCAFAVRGVHAQEKMDPWQGWKAGEAFYRLLQQYALSPTAPPIQGWEINVPSAAKMESNPAEPRRFDLTRSAPHPLSNEVSISVEFYEFKDPETAETEFDRSKWYLASGPMPELINTRGWDRLASNGYGVDGWLGKYRAHISFSGEELNERRRVGDPKRFGWNAGLADAMLNLLKRSLGQPAGPYPGIRWAEPGALGTRDSLKDPMRPYTPWDAAPKAQSEAPRSDVKGPALPNPPSPKADHLSVTTPAASVPAASNSNLSIILAIVSILGGVILVIVIGRRRPS